MRVNIWQKTSNLTCSSHSFMTIATIHGTNGIVIQASKHEFHGIVSHFSEPSSSRRHSFKPVSQELQPYIKSKYRPNPFPIQNLENDLNQLDGLISKHENIVWSILRHKSSGEKQVIPARKGFFFEITKANHWISANHKKFPN